MNQELSAAQQLHQFVLQHPTLFVLTGAGISLASGIPTYRDQNGVWQGSAPMQHNDFINHETIRKRYWARSFIGRKTISTARPNTAHKALAKLEQLGHIQLLVTQNVDNLHQTAGSHHVVDLHGNLQDVICLSCRKKSLREEMQQRLATLNPYLLELQAESRPDGDALLEDQHIGQLTIPACTACGGVLMPDVVFFGGTVPKARVEYCLQQLTEANAIIVAGSSLKVFSGYRFCLRAQEWGKPIALINPGKTRADKLAHLHLRTESAAILNQLVELSSTIPSTLQKTDSKTPESPHPP